MSEPAPSQVRSDAIRQATAYLETMLEAPAACRGQQLRGAGPVAEFETLLALRCGFPHCLATASATSGLLALVAAADMKERRVLVPEGFWSGTRGALRFAGVQTLTAPTTESGTLDLAAVGRLLGEGGIAALVAGEAEHRHGTAAELRQLCHDSRCLYLDDSSCLPGISVPHHSPSLADVQILSFGPGKSLTLGEGGAVLTRSRTLHERLVALSQHPERCLAEGIDCDPDQLALNARIHPLAAVLGVMRLSGL